MKLFFRNIKLFSITALAALSAAPAAYAHHESGELPIYERDLPDTCVPGAQQIRVTIIGATHKGLVKLELYSDASPDDFLEKDGRLRRIRVPARDEPISVCINVDAPGRFAVAGYHDLDADRRLDKKWNFKPKEPYGLSNNPKFKVRKKPSFDVAAFDVSASGADIDFILVDLTKD